MFEKFALDLWGAQLPGSNSTLYGRNGQGQNGVDVIVRSGDRLIGLQCKAVGKLDQITIAAEVDRAKRFTPSISDLVVVTTAPHDAKLVSHAETLTRQHKQSNLFSVSYHGWDDLLRILEDHQWVAHKHFSEFFSTTEKGIPPPPALRLPLDRQLKIMLSDEELALFCSEASWELKNNPSANFAVDHVDEQRAIAMVAEIEAVEALDTEARKTRSELREYLARLSPKIRRAEVAARLLLTDEVLRSPWLIGGCWPETAATMRRLMPQVIAGSISRPDRLPLKIGVPAHPKLVGYIDIDVEDRPAFEDQCKTYNPYYYIGGVHDLGSALGLKYALPAGIAALVGYSAFHGVAIEELQRDNTSNIYFWGLYAA
ncbi:hypothetical protein LOY37_09930 [Pseudomonas sp. B21-012]|uniref:hypothetical protein n=1 Tax=Pseudomonas sp. B21-012 TaxID=2895472 RepID=UPI0021606782|nr:hypothetical protein [Pseudomonas sp. B21-012]UVM57866.1 hypothetical protein LOY37_09930 [Pseudomonas sp. B21-012]